MNDWLKEFIAETGESIADPFDLCLAAAIASVECGRGERVIRGPEGFNEIGYKAISGRPMKIVRTQEAVEGGGLEARECAFRLFADRAEQARALLWLLRSSTYYEAARLLFVLTFYSAYAPGRREGTRALIKVFNELARTVGGRTVRPFGMINGGKMDEDTARINHAAARQGVRLFCEWTIKKGQMINSK